MPKYRSNFKRLAAITLVIAAFAVPGHCLEVTDALGRSVRVESPARRIVALNSDALEVLRILDVQERVVGVISGLENRTGFWGEFASRPRVGRWSDPDVEAIVALDPDLVLAYSRNPPLELEKKLAPFGIGVLRLDFYKPATLAAEVRTLGRIVGAEERAEAFCAWHGGQLNLIRERLAASTSRPPVYVENYADYHADGPGSGGDAICRLAGGCNVAGGFSVPYPRVTPEWVIARSPEVIFKVMTCEHGYVLADSGPYDAKRAAIMHRPAWEHVPAVRTGNVCVVSGDIFAGPRLAIGLSCMARAIHPELFADLDPERMHDHYLETFQKVPGQGVYLSSGRGSR